MTNLTPRMMKAAMIQKAAKSSHTAPERAFNAYQESRGMNLLWDKLLEFVTYDPDYFPITFQCDFVHFNGISLKDEHYDIDYEIDGEKFHSSGRQKRKDDWKDKIKARAGIKVIHIPAAVTAKRYWPYLDAEIKKALESKEMIIHIAG